MPRALHPDSLQDHGSLSLPQPGVVLIDRFELVELVGVGGMGAVYRAHDRHEDRQVAVKLLTIDRSNGLRRFRREFRAAAQLSHPNVVDVHGYFPIPRPFFTMEFVPGSTVTEWVGPARRDTRDADVDADAEAARTQRIHTALRQILEALDYIHAHGLVHRDLKPDNVLVTPDGCVKVMDFGVVRGSDGSSSSITQGRILGTLAYMAPEQLEGRTVDGRADLYSVGALLYELLTGEAPFEESPFGSLARAILEETPPAPRSLAPRADPALCEVAMTLLSKKPWQRFPSPREALATLDRVHRPARSQERPPLLVPQFVGRDDEMELARELLASVDHERLRMLFVNGVAGSGKTRLLEEIGTEARRLGMAVCELGKHAAGGDPVAELRAALSMSLPDRGNQWDTAAHHDPDPDHRSDAYRSISSLRGTIEAIAAIDAAAVVLLLDDADSHDRGLLELVRNLVRELVTPSDASIALPSLVIFATYDESRPRGDDLERLVVLASRLHLGAELRLRPFTREEADAVARSVLGAERVPGALSSWLFQETAGNPYFVCETLRHLVTENLLIRGRDGLTLNWRLLKSPPREVLDIADFADLPVAGGVQANIERHLTRLDPGTLKTLHFAAVLGREFDFETLERASGLDEEDLIDRLQTLIAARVLSEREDRPDTFRFVHDKLRRVVLSHLGTAELTPLHLSVAKAIERAPEPRRDPIALARHYDAAGVQHKAIDYLPDSAARLSRESDHAGAVDAWTRYVDLLASQAGPGPISLGSARCELARELAAARRLDQARTVLEQLLSHSHDVSGVRRRALTQLSYVESRLGHFDAAIARACELLALARAGDDADEEGEALRVLGAAQVNHGQFAEAEQSLAASEKKFAQAQKADPLPALLRMRAGIIAQQGRLREAKALIQTALAQARALGNGSAEQFSLAELGGIHTLEGGLDLAAECYQQALDRALALALPYRQGLTQNNFAFALIQIGDFAEAERLLTRSLRIAADSPYSAVAAHAHLGRAHLRRLAGQLERSQIELTLARETLGDQIHAGYLVEVRREESALELARGRHGPARRLAREALAIARGNLMAWHEAAIRIDLAEIMDGPAARRQAQTAADLASDMGAALLQAHALTRLAGLSDSNCAEARANAEAATRIVQDVARRLGRRERLFMRTQLYLNAQSARERF